MEFFRLKDMIKGWFVGNFEPTVLKTSDVEVGIKSYDEGTIEAPHYHKVATEITVIVSGQASMAGKALSAGDIVVIHPNETTDFHALSDVTTVVVKVPGANNDKYLLTDHLK